MVDKDHSIFSSSTIEYVSETSSHGLEICSYEVYNGDTSNLTLGGERQGVWWDRWADGYPYLKRGSFYQNGNAIALFCVYIGPSIAIRTSDWNIELHKGDTVNVYMNSQAEPYSSDTKSFLGLIDTVNSTKVEYISKAEIRALKRFSKSWYSDQISRIEIMQHCGRDLQLDATATLNNNLELQTVYELNHKEKFMHSYFFNSEYRFFATFGNGYHNESFTVPNVQAFAKTVNGYLTYQLDLTQTIPH